MRDTHGYWIRSLFPIWIAVLMLPACIGDAASRRWQGYVAQQQDSIRVLSQLLDVQSTHGSRLAQEKDTLIRTLQTSMVLFNELAALEREIVGAEPTARSEPLESWDVQIRSRLDRIRARYAALSTELARAEQRLRSIDARDARARAALDEVLRTAAALRADNTHKQELIDRLSGQLAMVEEERDVAVALSEARADTIKTLEDESNTVYWIAGSKDELRESGVVQVVGGRQLAFVRVGETLALGRGVHAGQFNAIDRRVTHVLALPDAAEYEIITQQNVAFADASTLRVSGNRWLVRGELRITDPGFWDQSPYLVLVRR